MKHDICNLPADQFSAPDIVAQVTVNVLVRGCRDEPCLDAEILDLTPYKARPPVYDDSDEAFL